MKGRGMRTKRREWNKKGRGLREKEALRERFEGKEDWRWK